MNQLFIPPELAQVAREKGFDEECLGYFKARRGKILFRLVGEAAAHRNSERLTISAPLYQQIIQWLFSRGIYLEDSWISTDQVWICDLRDRSGNLIWEDSTDNKSLMIQDAWNRAIARALHFLP